MKKEPAKKLKSIKFTLVQDTPNLMDCSEESIVAFLEAVKVLHNQGVECTIGQWNNYKQVSEQLYLLFLTQNIVSSEAGWWKKLFSASEFIKRTDDYLKMNTNKHESISIPLRIRQRLKFAI